jgi:predicted amidophosphoribosyltransferase
MPCQRCGARQGDPSRGPSAWRRAVSSGVQVLICPTCQQDAGWESGMDRCPTCESRRLSKTLGVLRCSHCGWSGEAPPNPQQLSAADEKLAEEVRAALGRVLRPPESTTREPR